MEDKLKTKSQLIKEVIDLRARLGQLEKRISENADLLKEYIEKNELLEYFLEASSTVLYRCIPEGDYPATFVSANIRRQLGYEPDDFIKDLKFWVNRIHPDDRERVFRELSALFEKGYHKHEYRFLHKDGTYRYMLDSMRLVYDDKGNPQDIIGNWIDITEKKKIENELQKAESLESLGLLAGGIAHDFNNLLGGLFGFIDLARKHIKYDAVARDYLENAMNCFSRARDLTQQLLTFAKGGMPVKKVVSVEPIARESGMLLLSGSNIQCKFKLPSELRMIEADRSQLHQVFDNIFLNSRQAMPNGGVIAVEADNETLRRNEIDDLPEGQYVRISLKDRGTGIPGNMLQKVFDPFFTTKQAGSGLGLATAYSIIRKHGGHISIDSEIGVGTSVTIHLPAAPETVREESEVFFPAAKGTGRILLMDDEEIIRNSVGQMLEKMGYEVVCAKNGEEAITLYEKSIQTGRKISAVILDLTVAGGMDGDKAIRKLLEIDPQVKGVVSSGYSDNPVLANPEKYGFKGKIAKPYRIEHMLGVLNTVLHDDNV
jgi:two-component system cell cycle sensor histidine kinase/response regulator CckA